MNHDFHARVDAACVAARGGDDGWNRRFRDALPGLGIRLAPPGTNKRLGVPVDSWYCAPWQYPHGPGQWPVGSDGWPENSELIDIRRHPEFAE